MIRHSFARFLALFALVCLAACSRPQEKAQPLVVLAAASLQEALNAEADAWAVQGHPRPTLSFAGSSALARQIESGAPADLFVSADEDWMDTVEKAGSLHPGTRRDLLTNSIVLIAPQASTATVDLANPASLARALGNGKLAMADPDAVPAGKYGKAALQHLKAWDEVAPKVARAENVRAALKLVETGEAPLGVVYATDAAASKKVRVIATFPADSHPPIRYPVAVLAGSKNDQAAPFEQFLASGQGQAIFARYGFGTIK
ncbi:MAG: molybdate ABC transporter substrate-binding protein [Porphyrobacter sp.]|nr:molybdate ABC transporter substrate-binding protein [Porphyrobacter sp.]